MIEINFLAILVAAIIPLIMGFLWYNPKIFGTIWMKEAELSEEKLKKGSMGLIFFLSFIFSIMIAFFLQFVTIHQFGAMGMIGGDETLAKPSYVAFMNDYGTAFRSFGHGALHSFITGFLFIFPVFAINALFEKKSWKYIFVNVGYWTITIMIMGGIVCGWYAIDGFNFVTPK
jgi:hypothetical protein